MTDRLIPFRRAGRRDERPDESLVTSCAGGDTGALEELFQRHGDRVHRIVARLGTVDRRDLDDVVQATFVTVQKAARRFQRGSTVATWIVGIALHLAQRHARGEARRRRAMTALGKEGPRSGGPRPDELAVHRQQLARLAAGFEALPADLKTVFALCELEGMRSVEVARALGVPEGTVWRRLHSARVRLRSALDGEGEGRR